MRATTRDYPYFRSTFSGAALAQPRAGKNGGARPRHHYARAGAAIFPGVAAVRTGILRCGARRIRSARNPRNALFLQTRSVEALATEWRSNDPVGRAQKRQAAGAASSFMEPGPTRRRLMGDYRTP